VAQFDPFELLPEALPRVQLGGLGRQAFQVEPLRRAIGQRLGHEVAAMNWCPVPENDHAAVDLTQQVLEKGDHILRIESMILTVDVQLAFRRDGADRGEMVAGVPLPPDGGLADRGVGAHHAGQGIEPGFVYEEDRVLLRLGPFVISGHVSSRQGAIAASSRWRARRAGFGGVQRMAWHKRPTWRG
jgi:hypothetical protein